MDSKKNTWIIFLSILTLVNVVILLITLNHKDAVGKQLQLDLSDVVQNVRGDISLNAGGIYSESTPSGDLWLYSSSENKAYYVTKPDSNGEIRFFSKELKK